MKHLLPVTINVKIVGKHFTPKKSYPHAVNNVVKHLLPVTINVKIMGKDFVRTIHFMPNSQKRRTVFKNTHAPEGNRTPTSTGRYKTEGAKSQPLPDASSKNVPNFEV